MQWATMHLMEALMDWMIDYRLQQMTRKYFYYGNTSTVSFIRNHQWDEGCEHVISLGAIAKKGRFLPYPTKQSQAGAAARTDDAMEMMCVVYCVIAVGCFCYYPVPLKLQCGWIYKWGDGDLEPPFLLFGHDVPC